MQTNTDYIIDQKNWTIFLNSNPTYVINSWSQVNLFWPKPQNYVQLSQSCVVSVSVSSYIFLLRIIVNLYVCFLSHNNVVLIRIKCLLLQFGLVKGGWVILVESILLCGTIQLAILFNTFIWMQNIILPQCPAVWTLYTGIQYLCFPSCDPLNWTRENWIT